MEALTVISAAITGFAGFVGFVMGRLIHRTCCNPIFSDEELAQISTRIAEEVDY